MEELKKHLLSKPSIQVVYFNENMQWLFYPRASFPTVMTRSEILGEEKPEEEKIKPEKKNGKK
jgi:hypothetical protein